MDDVKAPEPEKAEEIKRFNITKIIQNLKITPQEPIKDDSKQEKAKEKEITEGYNIDSKISENILVKDDHRKNDFLMILNQILL